MKKNHLLIIISFLISSCASQNVDKAVYPVFRAWTFPSIATTKILSDAMMEISQSDSVNSFYLQRLHVRFFEKKEIMDMEFDSLQIFIQEDTSVLIQKVEMRGDSVYYKNFELPITNILLPDTVHADARMEYMITIGDTTVKCIRANYLIKKLSIDLQDKFVSCEESE